MFPKLFWHSMRKKCISDWEKHFWDLIRYLKHFLPFLYWLLLIKRQNQKRKKKFISCKLLFIHYQLSYCIVYTYRPNDSVSSISNVRLDSLPLDFHFYIFLSVDTTTMPIIVVLELGLTTTIYIICLFKIEYLFKAPTVS